MTHIKILVDQKIKAHFTVSDGVANINCLMTDAIYQKTPPEMKENDVVKITAFKVDMLKEQKVLIIGEAPAIVCNTV